MLNFNFESSLYEKIFYFSFREANTDENVMDNF
jgi:hypothetical protein